MSRNGVIYVATGDDYVDLAVASARSLRRHNPDIEIDLFTDQPSAAPEEVFDTIHRVPRAHRRAKLDCLPLTRFDRTLFLDADTLVVAPFGDLFQVLDRFDIALAHDVRRDSELIQEGYAEATPYAFPQFNSGVILYRSSPVVLGLLDEWRELFLSAGLQRDQVILKDLLWRSDVRLYVLPPEFNLRRVTELDAWEPADARPTIVHSHRLMDHMTRPDTPRRVNLDEILQLERDALEHEWKAVGGKTDIQSLLKRRS